MDNKDKPLPEFLLKLIEGCSTYFKVSINFWIGLAVFSVFVVLPTEIGKTTIALPFNLGNVEKSNFYPFANLIISLLLISFGASFCQAIRTRILIQRVIDTIKDEYIFCGNIYLQDIVDSMIYPSLNRVAPLAQILQGKNQFFPEVNKISVSKRRLTLLYYMLLKCVSAIAMYIFPAYALFTSFIQGNLFHSSPLKIPLFFFWILSLFALIILLQLLILDVVYIKKVRKRFSPY